MRIEIEVELSEKVGPDAHEERRRFLRDVEMDLPEIGHEFELNVNKDLIMVTVVSMARNAADGLYHIRIKSDSLTFASLREDERWIETLL